MHCPVGCPPAGPDLRGAVHRGRCSGRCPAVRRRPAVRRGPRDVVRRDGPRAAVCRDRRELVARRGLNSVGLQAHCPACRWAHRAHPGRSRCRERCPDGRWARRWDGSSARRVHPAGEVRGVGYPVRRGDRRGPKAAVRQPDSPIVRPAEPGVGEVRQVHPVDADRREHRRDARTVARPTGCPDPKAAVRQARCRAPRARRQAVRTVRWSRRPVARTPAGHRVRSRGVRTAMVRRVRSYVARSTDRRSRKAAVRRTHCGARPTGCPPGCRGRTKDCPARCRGPTKGRPAHCLARTKGRPAHCRGSTKGRRPRRQAVRTRPTDQPRRDRSRQSPADHHAG